MSLIGLLVALIIGACILYLVDRLPFDGTIKRIIQVVVIVLMIVWLVDALGLFGGGPYLRLR